MSAQTNRTPLNRAFLQSNADGNRFAWTNLSRLTATGDVVAVVFTGSGSNLTDIVAASTNSSSTIKVDGSTLSTTVTSIDFTNNPNDAADLTGSIVGNNVTLGIRGDPVRKTMNGAPDVIWYTGGAGDWEDAGSMQAMLVLHQWGRLNLRGVGLGTGGWRMLSGTNRIDDASIEAMSALADYYRVNPGEVPFALYTNTTWGFLPVYSNAVGNIRFPKLYTQYMTNKGFGRLKEPNYPTTLKMFRKQLALAETNSLWFAINHPIAPITELFDSPADELSPLTGEQLFNSRVHQVSIMAGDYPYCTVVNGEYNISTSTGTAFSNVVARITRPITWIGFGIGRTTVSSAEPQHIKSMSRGWRLLSTANPMYDLTYQATTTGDAGRSAWGGVHAAIIGLGPARYGISNSAMTNISLTLYSNVFTTNTVVIDPVTDQDVTNQIPAGTYAGVVHNTSNVTVNLFGFVTTGTNRILANGSNYWHQDNIDHGQRYLSYINTNHAQYLLDQINYVQTWDPVVEKFDNSRTNNLGIGTASPVKRVHMQMPNASWGFWGDNNYAKVRFGLNLTTDYAEIASQGQSLLLSSGSKTNSVWYTNVFSGVTNVSLIRGESPTNVIGTNIIRDYSPFEFYRHTFDYGGPGLIGRSSTNGGWWFGGFPSDLLEQPTLGEVFAATRAVTPIVLLTNWSDASYIKLTHTNISLNGNAIDSWNDVTNYFTQIGGNGGGVSNAVNVIKEGGAQVGITGVTNLDFLGADFDLTESSPGQIAIVSAAGLTRDTEWDSVAELETATGANLLIPSELDTAAELAAIQTDESGNGGGFVRQNNATLVSPTLGVASATTLDTGFGANELYDMDQHVTTTSDVTFGSIIADDVNGTLIPASVTLVKTTDTLAVMAATTSAQLAGVLSDESGTGAAILANSNTQDSPTFTTKTVELGFKQVATVENSAAANFAFQSSSISTNANFNITVQNATSNVTLQVIYTNTSASWITGTLSTAFRVMGGATGVTATAIALAPTNITHVKYWTDRLTNYFMQYESGIPNLPLDSIAGGSPTAGDSLIYHSTVGWTNISGFDSYTNTWTADTPLVLGRTNYYATSGAATIGITGVGNLPTNVQRSTELTVLATGTVTFTNVAGIRTSDFVNSRTLTNGNVLVVGLTVIPGKSTNAAFAQFRAQ